MAQIGFGTAIPTADFSAAQNHEAATIPASGVKRVHWKCSLSGLLSQHRWLPLCALSGQGMVVNFYLAPAAESLILSHGGTTYSQTYLLRDVKALCSMCTISEELMESFQGQLLSGSAFRIPIKKMNLCGVIFQEM